MKRWIRDCGLTIVLGLLFLGSITGQLLTGFRDYNEELVRQGAAPEISIQSYITSGHFLSSVAENMESEFLQMALFVLLTVTLIQKGSAESKTPLEDLTKKEIEEMSIEKRYRDRKRKQYPYLWRLYENSLSLALFMFFAFFFFLHAKGSMEMINTENSIRHLPLISYWEVFGEPSFWFESFQNWQSEFFSMAALGVFSIFLRQYNSPQSKRMRDPFWKTGGEGV